MTLLVGILSTEGVVIATDKQVTHGVMGNVTVAQSGSKVEILNGQALYASAGPIAVGQQICAAMQVLQPKFGAQGCAESVAEIQAHIRAILNPAFDTAKRAQQVMGQLALTDVLCSGFLAVKFKNGIHLFDISHQGACEIMSTERVPFVCQGSGKQNADPILAFLWSVYWSKQGPSLREAILAGYWTVKIAIGLKSPMVGFEPEVFVLEKSGKEGKHVKARKIEDDELVPHDEFILAVENSMRDVRSRLVTPPSVSTPEPPTIS